jgi:hypothetical protein
MCEGKETRLKRNIQPYVDPGQGDDKGEGGGDDGQMKHAMLFILL